MYGIVKSGEQVRGKVKKLREGFKKIKDGHKETGNKWKQWKLYDKINDIMGNRPSVTPPVVLDTLEDSASASLFTEKITTDEEDEEKNKDSTDENNEREEDDKEESERERWPNLLVREDCQG